MEAGVAKRTFFCTTGPHAGDKQALARTVSLKLPVTHSFLCPRLEVSQSRQTIRSQTKGVNEHKDRSSGRMCQNRPSQMAEAP